MYGWVIILIGSPLLLRPACAIGAMYVQISQILQYSLTHAPELTAAHAQVSSAEAQRLSALASFLPTLTINNQIGRYRSFTNTGESVIGGTIVPTQNDTTHFNVAAAEVSLNLFRGGKDVATYCAALDILQSSTLSTIATLDSLFQKSLSDYVTAVNDQLTVSSQRRVLLFDEAMVRLTMQRVKGEYADRLDVLKVEQRMLSTRTSLAQDLRQEVTDIETLYYDVGMPNTGQHAILDAWLPNPPEVIPKPNAVQEDPQVQSALAAVRASEHDVKAARAAALPTVTLAGRYDLLGESEVSLSAAARLTRGRDESVFLEISIPLTSYVSARAAVDEQLANVTTAESKYQNALTNAASRIADTPRQLENARNVFEIATAADTAARATVTLTYDSYKAGHSSKIDLEGARQQAELADLSLATARINLRLAGWEMVRAINPKRFPSELLAAVAHSHMRISAN